MISARFPHFLASTALGVSLALAGHAALAQSKTDAEIEAAVPIPETLDLPPLTAKDVGPVTGSTPPADTTATKKPAAVVAESDPLADKLREIVLGRLDRYIDNKEDRNGVDLFYHERNYAPLWISKGAANSRAKAAIAYLAGVDRDGLVPEDYPVPDFQNASGPDALAAAEFALVKSVLRYARHAQIGRIHYTRVGRDIDFDLVPPNPADVLRNIAGTEDIAAALDSYNPPHQGYRKLKAKLAELRQSSTKQEDKIVRIPAGPSLKPGMKDKRVLALRERLEINGDRSDTTYDKAVTEAVMKFQTEKGLHADGVVGPNTLSALNGLHRPMADPVDLVIVNMERWRWLPRELGSPRVMTNIPDYSLKVVKDEKTLWRTNIVVGKPSQMTPMTRSEMKYITVNPTWNVPPSIIENEYLPALMQDPTVLDRYGLMIEQNNDGVVRIYQPPGDANALGRMRFNFPNKFLVYQHDTNEKHLLTRDRRAYSHGCMRVKDPLQYGELLLSLVMPEEKYTQARLRSMYGPNEININFPKPIPVYLVYETAFVDDDGQLHFREDVYGRDARMIALFKSGHRKVADIAIQHPRDTSALPVVMPPGTYGGGAVSYSFNGPSFFDFLFGGRRVR